MGKSSKKSATKVDSAAAAAAVVVPQSGKKGKRGAENGTEKVANLKKQKLERDETVVAKQKAEKKQPKKVASSSSDEDSDESNSDIEPKVAAKKTPTPAKKGSAVAKISKMDSSSDASESSEIDSDDSDRKPAAAATPKKKAESSDSDSDEEEDSSDSDEEPEANKTKVQATKKSDSSNESSEDDDSEEEETQKTPKKKDADAQKSATSTFQKTPNTPATTEATGSKTLFVANLSFSVEESDVREFFKEAGEVVDVRFASNAEGQFRGFGHVEFATVEAAKKAMELNGEEMLGRAVRLDLARERGAFTPQSRENNSFQKGGRSEGQTAFVRGFDTSLGEDEIRSALQEHFGSCGEITRISIPPDFENGGVKGMAYMNFADSNGFNAALELDGSDLGGGHHLNVQEAKPRGDSPGGSGGRFDRGGGRSGGRRGGRDGGGRFSGRGGRDGGRGGRFSGRGGRDGGGRGRGAPYRNNAPSGKKTTFGDD
ncbi:hypothetical protein RND81_11G079100 [Saponaria officinalis]|uniref:RRM domain-containing protein n=1 Tax=Saponaria officinalis TaxID=3572 RepID=A0AAW1HK88_SAPOF